MTAKTAKTAKTTQQIAQRLFDAAVERVGGGRAWVRMVADARDEQLIVSAFGIINGRFDAQDNDRPVIADVMAALESAREMGLLARHG
jgi:hypothetical protein